MSLPVTHAQASRQRRDLVSGEVMDEARLIRFVGGPDGMVVPDLARKLPGRGLWVAATRASIEQAGKKNLFARAAKTKLTVPGDLVDQIEAGLKSRLLAGLGLARRAGDLIFGFEKVASAIASGKCAWLIEASDGAFDGRRKMRQAVRRSAQPPNLFGLFNSADLGLALGGENVIHLALLAGRPSAAWASDARRLEGFCPLLPESWREES
jgi:predicted RNA-binding protein YlxR (DUF448 family)